ncbi:zinc-binding dehydrogenase [Kitasatospora sp. NBC_01266]|uniref:zinc-binding dehydrogenase n=1 Tax=Kitasatospora sp. NBC_01266 TaxID=2903572 RepID=UPI002E3329E2|nr:alcohol dehydrogenase catalytic domain-containing protein [Kitasatospora sp. NBC_01266]
MTTARAVVLRDFATPPAVASFELPPAPADGLTVACRYGGICGTDLHLAQGHLPVPVPLVLGHEGLGTVHELGPGTTQDSDGAPLAVGDTVMWASSIACGECHSCRTLREPTLCARRQTYGVNRPTSEASPLRGSWAQYITLEPRTAVFRLAPGTDPVAAMALACAGPTMIHALWERRPVRLGETVVVQGSGPVGLAAACLAQLAGARVLLVGGPASRLAAARAAGIADEYIDTVETGTPEQALARVLELTGGLGADLVIECAGVPVAVEQGTRMARRGGSYLIVGQYTDSGSTSFNPHQIVHRQLDLVGSWAFTGAHLGAYIRLLPQLLARFDLASLVTTFPLDQVGTAMGEASRGTALKAVLAC